MPFNRRPFLHRFATKSPIFHNFTPNDPFFCLFFDQNFRVKSSNFEEFCKLQQFFLNNVQFRTQWPSFCKKIVVALWFDVSVRRTPSPLDVVETTASQPKKAYITFIVCATCSHCVSFSLLSCTSFFLIRITHLLCFYFIK